MRGIDSSSHVMSEVDDASAKARNIPLNKYNTVWDSEAEVR
jgi:hypothetical protein